VQAVKDAATFFETEVPGVPEWTFGPEQAGPSPAPCCPCSAATAARCSSKAVSCSTPGSRTARADIAGATHLLQMQAPAAVAAAIAAFL
jgi:hypothetical protein